MHPLPHPNLIHKLKKTIKNINIHPLLQTPYIQQFIQHHTYSPFPHLQYTQTPHTLPPHLLQAPFPIFTHNTPFLLTPPITFSHLIHPSQHYYHPYFISNLIRSLPYIFLFLPLYFPAIYVPLITYHH
ncbi:spore germination protein, partial [Bacillus subtilis]|uniref:spore germination protein n=1 Tax=Bacillus subtilis TaxID=1423 RepID=UPI00339064D7